MKNFILKTIATMVMIYFMGMAWVLLHVAYGGDGQDVLSQHYQKMLNQKVLIKITS